ncbi:sterol O-acyltransferase 1 isoform X1 [Pieris brassicae]|uniref:sterol O-acyltransferase 1 isoform X1 n=1 Tax=Pieris brassicae TaxID=7116 RepID=UPI001E6622E0|nr:sterol O-acyltransferase 1 isoform X1 [Pieris brassicae]XP_045518869.1 sterol O-acyltransferase 1 isoform X1 [Pieris brassicae]
MERVARRRNHENDNGYSKEKDKDPEFVHRESVLTVLMNESLHIKAIYHIFVAILIMLFLDTVIYDIVERGKLNVGIASVVYGFGDIKRAFKIWLFELTVALIFYPGLRIYATTRKLVKKSAASCQLLAVVGVICLILLQICLIGVPCWELGRKHLAVGSSVAVTCEMFRFAMKICAVAGDCIPRCHNDQRPLPPFQHYLYFLFAPTLIYRDSYPRTKKIRWGMVLFHFSEVAAVVFYNCFLWERFILPYWSDYGKKPQVEAGTVVRGMFACVLPGLISFLCGFYCLLHAWLNAFAEIMTFGDRLFYEDWWTKSRYSNYYRAWNRVVSSWLRDYIFRPITPFAGRPLAYVTVFFVSSVAHEVILALGFGFFYPVLLIQFGVMGVMLLPLTATAGKRFPSIFNMFMWLSFFIGTGMLWSLYPMEYFARKNCPPSENDSFFIPKSWSCPKIVLKPNWTFENPFDLNIE